MGRRCRARAAAKSGRAVGFDGGEDGSGAPAARAATGGFEAPSDGTGGRGRFCGDRGAGVGAGVVAGAAAADTGAATVGVGAAAGLGGTAPCVAGRVAGAGGIAGGETVRSVRGSGGTAAGWPHSLQKR